MSLTFHFVLRKLYTEPFIGASYQVMVYLAKQFQRRRFFLEINQSETMIACSGYVCYRIGTKWAAFWRGPSIDAFYQVWIHLAKWFQRRRFIRNRPIRNQNCLRWPCLLRDRDEMSNLYRGPPYMLSTTFWFIWLSGFRVGDFLEIDQSKTRIACGGHVCKRIEPKLAFIENLP